VSAELAAAVSNAGRLGSVATAARSADDLRLRLERVQELTVRPYAVNHVINQLDPAAFAMSLEFKPAVVSFAIGHPPAELIEAAHAAGAFVMQQVHTVARRAAEAGGNSGRVPTLPLVPQVAAAVDPLPVVAAGGIADGRGLAAALMLGAHGVNIGTRFIASVEAAAHEDWKQAIVAAQSEDTVRFETWELAFSAPGGDYPTLPRTIPTTFIAEWEKLGSDGAEAGEVLRAELIVVASDGRMHELVPMAGESVGLIGDILPAAVIIDQFLEEAERAPPRGPHVGLSGA
jgi:nitronate monooxygenase/enoyl-[acyl-carrier protein] reductase II